MKTINYELAKKLHDAGVVIESEKKHDWRLLDDNDVKYPAPNVEEVIEFLKIHIRSITHLSRWSVVLWKTSDSFEWDTLFECIETTLEYLLDNWYIWNK